MVMLSVREMVTIEAALCMRSLPISDDVGVDDGDGDVVCEGGQCHHSCRPLYGELAQR